MEDSVRSATDAWSASHNKVGALKMGIRDLCKKVLCVHDGAAQGRVRPPEGYPEARFEQIENEEVKAEFLAEVVRRKEEDAVTDAG